MAILYIKNDEGEFVSVPSVAGADGRGIVSVELLSGDHSAGTSDTYRITFTDGGTFDYRVYNGADGEAESGTAKVQSGSYTGTGKAGSDNPCALSFDFAPKFVVVNSAAYGTAGVAILHAGCAVASVIYGSSSVGKLNVSWNTAGTAVGWYSALMTSEVVEAQLNASNVVLSLIHI